MASYRGGVERELQDFFMVLNGELGDSVNSSLANGMFGQMWLGYGKLSLQLHLVKRILDSEYSDADSEELVSGGQPMDVYLTRVGSIDVFSNSNLSKGSSDE